MNLIDKIIDRLDALDKFKERVYIWYNYKDTQVALAIILFLVLIGTVLYFIFDVGLPWYWSLIFVCSLCIGILYLIVRYTRNKRKNIGTVMAVPSKTIGLDFNRMVLDNIYYVLRGYEKIDVEKTGIDNFHAVLTQQFEDTDSEIHFIAMNWGKYGMYCQSSKKNAVWNIQLLRNPINCSWMESPLPQKNFPTTV